MTKLREIKSVSAEKENRFLSALFLDMRMLELSNEYDNLHAKKMHILGPDVGEYNGWISVCDDAQEIKDNIKKA